MKAKNPQTEKATGSKPIVKPVRLGPLEVAIRRASKKRPTKRSLALAEALRRPKREGFSIQLSKFKVGKKWVAASVMETAVTTVASIPEVKIPSESPPGILPLRKHLALAETVRRYAQAALPTIKNLSLAAMREFPMHISASMDPRLQVACARSRMGLPSRGLASATAEEIAVVAKVTDVAEWEAISEVRVGTTVGSALDGTMIVTARIPVARVEAVRAQPCVQSLKASQPVRPALAATISEMGCNQASFPQHTAPDGGAGVVIGIVDFGCDFMHENFRNAAGSTRLLAIWDQSGSADANSPFNYGRLYMTGEINQALQNSDPYEALGYAPPPSPPNTGAHGTHVMDIAAGNGRGTGTHGCAPKADLIFVEAAASDIAWAGADATRQSFGDSVQMLEALKFIFQSAGNRPCVVNLSLGTNGGPHDGSTLVEQGIDALVRGQSNRAVVIAGSNSFSDGIHAAGTVPAAGTFDLEWQTDVGQLDRELEIWLPGNAQVAAEIFDPDGTSLGVAEPGNNLALGDGAQLAIFASNRLAEPNNNDNTISIYIAGGVAGGNWRVRLHSRNGVAAPFHAWIERQDDEQSHFPKPHDNSHTIGSISCGYESIVVGSFDAHKAARPISFFSSSGPTRDKRQKPEVSAPGHSVIAARSRSRNGSTHMSGTSMAAPAVTGLIALVLAEARRRGVDLTSAQIRSAVMQSVVRNPPEIAAGGWDARYGHGRVQSAALALVGGNPPPAGSGAAKAPGKKRKPGKKKEAEKKRSQARKKKPAKQKAKGK